MINYTSDAGDIVIGARWPVEGNLTIALTQAGGWAAGAASRIWRLHVSSYQSGGTPKMTLTSQTSVVVGTVLTLTFYATPTQTAELVAGRNYVDLESVETSGETTISRFYDVVAGKATVRNKTGEVE